MTLGPAPGAPQAGLDWDGALLIHKPDGISSFGVIERLQDSLIKTRGVRKRDLPKMGHGGTLDPFATGLLILLVGRGVKLARYFLGSTKAYSGVFRFGETTVPGDPTSPVSERSDNLPASIDEIREWARKLSAHAYLQTPPMHSAKKHEGRPLYELAREGIEVERQAKSCTLYSFEILSYERPRAEFKLVCTSGTYVRTLAQDLGKLMGTVAMLEKLERTGSGEWALSRAQTLDEIITATAAGRAWTELGAWIPFDQLLRGYAEVSATDDEARALTHGQQGVLINLLRRTQSAQTSYPLEEEDCLIIYHQRKLLAVARRENQGPWAIERVFVDDTSSRRIR